MAMGAVLSSNLRAEDLHEDAFEDELYLGGHGIVRRGDRWILMNGLTYPAPPILRGSGIDLETGDIHVGDIQMNNEDPLLDAFLGKVWRDGKLEGRQMIAANRLSTGGYIERFFKNPLRELELERFFVDNTELPKSDLIVLPGGFSYGDVLGAGEGWAKSILFNDIAREQFKTFFEREDTFALGVCNGCQLMILLNILL